MEKPEGRIDPPLVTCSPFPRGHRQGHHSKHRSRGTPGSWAPEPRGAAVSSGDASPAAGAPHPTPRLNRGQEVPGSGDRLRPPRTVSRITGTGAGAARCAPLPSPAGGRAPDNELGRECRGWERTQPPRRARHPRRAVPGHPRGALGRSGGRGGWWLAATHRRSREV